MSVRSDRIFVGAISSSTYDLAQVPAGQRWILKQIVIHGAGERVLLVHERLPRTQPVSCRFLDETIANDVILVKSGLFLVFEATDWLAGFAVSGSGNTQLGLYGSKLVL